MGCTNACGTRFLEVLNLIDHLETRIKDLEQRQAVSARNAKKQAATDPWADKPLRDPSPKITCNAPCSYTGGQCLLPVGHIGRHSWDTLTQRISVRLAREQALKG
jgi:hypothetical protein